MISKSYVFGGGLLVNTIAIFASISGDAVATEGLHKFRNQLNQIYWRISLNHIENVITSREPFKNVKWILEPKYKDSRTKVIGNAIADCVTGENEFKDKNAGDIITFKDTNPVTYKQEHWNAVILYNYINEALNVIGETYENNYRAKIANVQYVLNNTIDMIKEHYKNYFVQLQQQYDSEQLHKVIDEADTRIDKAVRDIQAYVDVLGLDSYLLDFYCDKVNYSREQNIDNLAPGLSDVWDMSESGKMDSGWKIDFSEPFYTPTEYNESLDIFTKRTAYYPSFMCQGGKLYFSGLLRCEECWISRFSTGYESGWKQDKTLSIDVLAFLKQKQGQWILDLLKEGIVALPDQDQLAAWNASEEEKAA